MGRLLRCARLIGELTKFRVCEPALVFGHIHRCILDLPSAGAVAALCTLLERAGRFLFLTPETHAAMQAELALLRSTREARHLLAGPEVRCG